MKTPHMTLMKIQNTKDQFFDAAPITQMYKEHEFGMIPL
jgi:hypothetical protein